MLYLLDANVLIDANRDYYPITRVPEFWVWLVFNGVEGYVKIPREMHEEVKTGTDDLGEWAKGSMPFLVEIANGSMGSRHLFEAAFQLRLQRAAQADQLLAAAHFA